MRTVLASLACLACLHTAEVRVAPLFGHQDTILAADHDATQAATIDTRLRLWDLLDGNLLWMEDGTPPASDWRGPRVALGRDVVVVARSDDVRVYDRASGRLRWQEVAKGGDGPESDGRTVILMRNFKQRVLLDARDGRHLLDLPPGGSRYMIGGEAVLLQDGSRLQVARPVDGGWRLSPDFTAPAGGPDLSDEDRRFLLRGPDGEPRLLTVHLRRRSEAEAAAAEKAEEAFEPIPPQDAVCRWWTVPPQAAPEREVLVRGLGRLPECVLPDGTLLTQPVANDWRENDMRVAPPGTAARLRPGSPTQTDLLVAGRQGRRVLLANGVVASVEDADDGDNPLIQLRGPAAPPTAKSLVRSSDGRRLAASTAAGVAVWDLALLRLDRFITYPGELTDHLAPGPLPGLAAGMLFAFGWEETSFAPYHLVDVDGTRPWAEGLTAQKPGFSPSPDGKRLASLVPGHLEVRDATTGAVLQRLPLAAPYGVTGDGLLAWTARGDLLAARSATYDFSINGGGETSAPSWRAVVVRADGRVERANGEGGAETTLPLLPGAAATQAGAAQTSLPAGNGGWWAGCSAAIGPCGEIVLTRTGSPPVRLLASSEAWATWSDDGLFDGSRSAARLLAASRDGVRMALDEAVPLGCRPDELLRRLGCDDTELLRRATRRAAAPPQTRPELRAIGQPAHGRLGIAANATAGAADLAALDVWVDGVPQAGAALAGKNGKAALAIGLPPWPAVVEVAARDAAGTSSWRARLPALPAAMADSRVIGACLGVSRYRDQALALRYAAKDAIDVALALDGMRPGGRDALVRVWTDEQVAPPALAEVRSHLAQAEPQDLVVLYLAGHGLWLRQPQPMWHLLPVGASAADPGAGAIPWSAVVDALQGCRALRRLIILDTCESGVLDEDAPTGAGLAIAGARGLRSRTANATTGLAAEWEARDRERLATADLTRTTGAVVLASSRGGEPSFESEGDANGLFTQELLTALHGPGDRDGDGWITPGELVARLAQRVGERSGGRQRPTIDRDNPLAQIRLPVLPKSP